MTRLRPLALLFASAALISSSVSSATSAHAEEAKVQGGGSLVRLSGGSDSVGDARSQLAPRAASETGAQPYTGSLTLYAQNYTRSANAQCEDLPAQLDLTTGSDYESGSGEWSSATVEWRVSTPYGDNYNYGDVDSDGSYEFDAIYWCPGADGFGTFPLDVDVTYYDSNGNAVGYDTASEPFTVTRAAVPTSKVTFTKKNFRAHGSKFDVRVSRNGSAWAGRQVVMQAKFCGGWQKMFTKRTNSAGRATITVNPEAGWNTERFCGSAGARIPFRFSVAGDARTRGDVSPTFRVVRR